MKVNLKTIDKILIICIIIVGILIYKEISGTPRDTELENFYKHQPANGSYLHQTSNPDIGQ